VRGRGRRPDRGWSRAGRRRRGGRDDIGPQRRVRPRPRRVGGGGFRGGG
jgi:hypothetical protein